MDPPARRSLGRGTLLSLGVGIALGLALAVVTDREFMITYGYRFEADREPSRLPVWLQEWGLAAVRLQRGGTALLAGLGLGAAVPTLRVAGRRIRPARLGPGHVAVLITAFFFLMFTVRWAIALWIGLPGSMLVHPIRRGGIMPLGFYFDFTKYWYFLRPQITWCILGAWLSVAAARRWRRPIDALDRLGRWLGAGWLALMLWSGVVGVLLV